MKSAALHSVSQVVSQLFGTRHDRMTIDCGSSNTRMYLGKRLVFDEPTAVAVQVASKNVVAIGKKAQALIGKTPPGVTVFFPVYEGRVAEPEYLKYYLQVVLQRVAPGFSVQNMLFGAKGVFGLPTAATSVEQQLFQEVLQQAGLGGLQQVSRIQGGYTSCIPNPKDTQPYCVVAIGGQTTEVGVFSAGNLAYEARLGWGGIRFTELIQSVLNQHEQLAVGWHTAEQAKQQLPGLQDKKSRSAKIAIRGKDIVSQVSKTTVVEAGVFAASFEAYITELLEFLELFFSELPTELATSCLEHGIFVTGGASQMVAIPAYITEHLHAEVHTSANPSLAIAQGLVKMHVPSA